MLPKEPTNQGTYASYCLPGQYGAFFYAFNQCVSESLHLKNKQNFKGMTQKEEHIAESGSLKDRIMAMPHDSVLFRSVKKDFENREQMFSEILKKKLGV